MADRKPPMTANSLFLVLVLSAFTASAAQAQLLKCEIKNKYVCEAGGCASVPAKEWKLVDSVQRTYTRCDVLGCDKYDAQFSRSGAYINIDIPARGVIAKIATDTTFHEVATLGHRIFISFGSCIQN